MNDVELRLAEAPRKCAAVRFSPGTVESLCEQTAVRLGGAFFEGCLAAVCVNSYGRVCVCVLDFKKNVCETQIVLKMMLAELRTHVFHV